MKARLAFFTLLTFASTVALGQGVVSIDVAGGISGLKNQPFSADEISITDRVLADGNHIHQETRGKRFRDSEGRQRTENEFVVPGGNGTRHIVMIFDPVRRVHIFLNLEMKTATLNSFPNPATAPKNLVSAAPVHAATGPKTSPIEMKHEDLGTQVIEGVMTKGVRMTETIPAGLEGNDQPIVTVWETWRGVDLDVVVLSQRTDPRTGTTERRLTNIQRAEPDPALFQIPPDYVTKENHSQVVGPARPN